MSNNLRVLTLGTFDLLHTGHLHLFKKCAELAGDGGEVIVAVNPDEFIKQFKGKYPVQTFLERQEMVASCRWVDVVIQTPGPDASALIDDIDPHFIVIGSDWAPPKDYYGQLGISEQFLTDRAISLVFLDRLPFLSSTNLKERVRSNA